MKYFLTYLILYLCCINIYSQIYKSYPNKGIGVYIDNVYVGNYKNNTVRRFPNNSFEKYYYKNVFIGENIKKYYMLNNNLYVFTKRASKAFLTLNSEIDSIINRRCKDYFKHYSIIYYQNQQEVADSVDLMKFIGMRKHTVDSVDYVIDDSTKVIHVYTFSANKKQQNK